MVKRRTPTASKKQSTRKPTEQEIAAYTAEADGGAWSEEDADPSAKRNYKKILVPFNQYEFRYLEEACKKTRRSKSSLIRWAVIQFAKKGQ